jgi:hypothetical protein
MVVFELGTMSPIRDVPGLFGSGAVSDVTRLGEAGMRSPRHCAKQDANPHRGWSIHDAG